MKRQDTRHYQAIMTEMNIRCFRAQTPPPRRAFPTFRRCLCGEVSGGELREQSRVGRARWNRWEWYLIGGGT